MQSSLDDLWAKKICLDAAVIMQRSCLGNLTLGICLGLLGNEQRIATCLFCIRRVR